MKINKIIINIKHLLKILKIKNNYNNKIMKKILRFSHKDNNNTSIHNNNNYKINLPIKNHLQNIKIMTKILRFINKINNNNKIETI